MSTRERAEIEAAADRLVDSWGDLQYPPEVLARVAMLLQAGVPRRAEIAS